MNDVRTIRADSMQEALTLVRQEMGADAVILHTRQVDERTRLPWRKKRRRVEITAGQGVNVPSVIGARSRGVVPMPASGKSRLPAPLETAPIPGKPKICAESLPTAPANTPVAIQPATAPAPARQSAQPSPQATQELTKRLDSMQRMIEDLGRSSRFRGPDEVPDELFHLYTGLIDSEVEDDLARELTVRLKQQTNPDQLQDAAFTKSLLAGMVESEIRCGPTIQPVPGQRKVVALVGPTGVGKTTTIAKLAANFRIRDGIKMGLVTVDTYRIAAVEQLRTYAEIIDLPMKVVTSPLEMRRALDELVGLDLVLIDTAGRSPRDELKIQELKSLLAEAQVDEVHLVMSMTASLRSLQATAENFAVANTTSMILTKLDEAAGMGSLLSVSRNVPLPVSYLTTGQDVPDDIEPADATRVARLILGQDQLFD